MKSIKTLTAIFAIASAQLMSSCLGTKSEDNIASDSYTGYFNAVMDQTTGDITLYSGQSIKVDWNYSKWTATLQLNGLKLPNGTSYPLLEFQDVPYTINSRYWLDITQHDAVPVGAASYDSGLVFDSFTFQTVYRQYTIGGQTNDFYPCLSCVYTINNQYKVFVLPEQIVEIGESVITDQSGEEYKPSIEENLTVYYVVIDVTKKTGFVVIQGAKFAESMPSMNLKFADIPLEVTSAGTIIMSLKELTPQLMGNATDLNATGTPAPGFPITDFYLTYISDWGMRVNYNCTPTGKDGQPMGMYSVQFKTEFPTSTNTAQ